MNPLIYPLTFLPKVKQTNNPKKQDEKRKVGKAKKANWKMNLYIESNWNKMEPEIV
uniref:Uncharacterized protein n=1 Tax=Tetranychus urticae TaxID=32264 RepID=T1KG27_TETUR